MSDLSKNAGSATGQFERSNKNKADKRLSAMLAEILPGRGGIFPVWIRPPRNNSLEVFSGLSRAKLYELANEGRILSFSIRKPGQVKGTRLFHLGSILEYLEEEFENYMTQQEKARAELLKEDPQ